MDILAILLTFIASYGVFMLMAYGLGKLFFPAIEVGVLDDEKKVKRSRHRTLTKSRFTSAGWRYGTAKSH